jgi:hypothetical protein
VALGGRVLECEGCEKQRYVGYSSMALS